MQLNDESSWSKFYQSCCVAHLYPRVSGALLDAQEVGVRRQVRDDGKWDVLRGPRRHVVDDCRPQVQACLRWKKSHV